MLRPNSGGENGSSSGPAHAGGRGRLGTGGKHAVSQALYPPTAPAGLSTRPRAHNERSRWHDPCTLSARCRMLSASGDGMTAAWAVSPWSKGVMPGLGMAAGRQNSASSRVAAPGRSMPAECYGRRPAQWAAAGPGAGQGGRSGTSCGCRSVPLCNTRPCFEASRGPGSLLTGGVARRWEAASCDKAEPRAGHASLCYRDARMRR